jgi:hypothetical protein
MEATPLLPLGQLKQDLPKRRFDYLLPLVRVRTAAFIMSIGLALLLVLDDTLVASKASFGFIEAGENLMTNPQPAESYCSNHFRSSGSSLCYVDTRRPHFTNEPNLNGIDSVASAEGKLYALVPTVFLLGCQKCASSSLSNQMMHVFPELVNCGSKERHFFDQTGNLFGLDNCTDLVSWRGNGSFTMPGGISRVKSDWLFHPACKPKDTVTPNISKSLLSSEAIGIDSTPNNLFAAAKGPAAMRRMYGDSGQALKFLAILRDPADRLRSYFDHFQPELNFDHWANAALDTLAQNPTLCDDQLTGAILSPTLHASIQSKGVQSICHGIYVFQIRRWVGAFTPAQFLVMSFTAYLDDPSQALISIGSHLGLMSTARSAAISAQIEQPSDENTAADHAKTNKEGFNGTMTAALRTRLDAFYAPYFTELRQFLNTSGVQVGPTTSAVDTQFRF